MKLRLLLPTVVMLAGTGCSPVPHLREVTSAQVGCPENNIDIRDHASMTGTLGTKWTAECQGKRFFCTEQNGVYGANQAKCTEDVTSAKAPAPATSSKP